MHDTPTALQEICIDALCDVVWSMACTRDEETASKLFQPAETSDGNDDIIEEIDVDDGQKQETTPNSLPLRIPCVVSDDLLDRMSRKNLLNDGTLHFFDSNRTTLKHVRIDAGRNDITINGLEILSEHELESLSLQKFSDHLEFSQVVENCLNARTRANLLLLDVRGTFGYSLVDRSDLLSCFGRLRSLVVADTSFDDSCLQRVCKDLVHLESLDISHTKVKDIGPLLLTKDRLRILLIHRPRLRCINDALDVLVRLRKLEILDVSDKISGAPDHHSDQQRGRLGVSLIARACGQKIWNSITALEMSGDQANFDTNEFRSFLSHHSTVKFLGLLMTNACYFDCLSANSIKVAGGANKAQIMTALDTYISRDYFCSRSMYLLFTILQQNEDGSALNNDERVCCIEQVIRGLQAHFDSLSVCMAGTACLYNLCRGNGANGLRPSLLRQIVECSLTTIEWHAQVPQLHKNVWLTLCNDHLLQSGTFDMFRCCTCALDSMVRNVDASITRMTVAIISILAAKIPTEMTTKLGTNPAYMRFLLNAVSQKTEAQHDWYVLHGLDANDPEIVHDVPAPDVTLRFTLSALWNLTDESPATCRCLLDERGLDVVIGVLEVFRDHSVETKVLGLLNNVAEVHDLRSRLLSQSPLNTILRLLKSPKIDVSYFAAGILAHLCADECWDLCEPTREYCLNALEETISDWVPADTEMVAYRSFKPFFALLAKDNMPAVQLWAVWAIRHVCSKNVDRYVDMFKSEGGRQALEHVLTWSTDKGSMPECTGRLIYDICKDILDLLV